MGAYSKVLPTVLMVIDLGAGIVYLCGGDIRSFIYWTAAAVLTASVTF